MPLFKRTRRKASNEVSEKNAGRHRPVHGLPPVPDGTVRCDLCEGMGAVSNIRCSLCKGRGWVLPEGMRGTTA